MTLIGRKILLTNTDASGNPTLDFPITSIECVEGGASQEDLDTTNNTLTENTTNLQAQVDNLRNELTFMASNSAYALKVVDYVAGSYITFSNGLQIVMGALQNKTGSKYSTHTFPKPFLTRPIVVAIPVFAPSGLTSIALRSQPTISDFTINSLTDSTEFHYIAIGMGAVVL